MPRTAQRNTTQFRVNNVPVNIQPTFWPVMLGLWGVLTWVAGRRRPERSLGERLLVGALSAPIMAAADVGHAVAHTVSARLSGAPMDEILLSHSMPRTLYADNSVAPRVHRTRALGGPIFNVLGLLTSLLWRRAVPPRSLASELADLSCAAHGLILVGSLAPLPMVDGGTILKWTLVDNGCTPEDADAHVRRSGVAIIVGVVVVAGALVTRRMMTCRRRPGGD